MVLREPARPVRKWTMATDLPSGQTPHPSMAKISKEPSRSAGGNKMKTGDAQKLTDSVLMKKNADGGKNKRIVNTTIHYRRLVSHWRSKSSVVGTVQTAAMLRRADIMRRGLRLRHPQAVRLPTCQFVACKHRDQPHRHPDNRTEPLLKGRLHRTDPHHMGPSSHLPQMDSRHRHMLARLPALRKTRPLSSRLMSPPSSRQALPKTTTSRQRLRSRRRIPMRNRRRRA